MGVVDPRCGHGVSERLGARLPRSWLGAADPVFLVSQCPMYPRAELRFPAFSHIKVLAVEWHGCFLQGYLQTLSFLLSRTDKLAEEWFLTP